MGERVAVVEQCSSAALALVGGDDLGLDLHTPSDPLIERQCQQIVAGEEVVLRHLAQAATGLPIRKCGEGVEVADHARWLPERPDEVLSLREIDAGLATDGGVDHAEQRGRHVHHRGAPVPRGRCEPGDVGHHATADADDHVAARESLACEPSHQRLDRGQRLGGLAAADHMGLDIVIGQRDGHRNLVLGDNGDALRRRRQQAGELGDGSFTDDHVVGAILERNVHAQHRSTAFATSFGERWSTDTTASATS